MASQGKPMLEIAPRLGAGFLRREVHRGGEGMAGNFVDHNPVAGYVHEEGPAAPKLVVHVHDGVNDEVDRRCQVLCDGQLLQKPFSGLFPGFMLLRKAVVVHDDEHVIIGAIAALVILDPIAARIGAEQDQLEDATALSLLGELGFQGILELIEQDSGDPFQLAPLAAGEAIEAANLHRTAP